MDAKEKEILMDAGIDVDGGIERCMGNEALYKKLIKRIWQDANYQEVLSGMEAGSMDQVLKAAHTLKGISGNLGFIRLYEITEEIVKQIREEHYEEIGDKIAELAENYEKVMSALDKTGNH